MSKHDCIKYFDLIVEEDKLTDKDWLDLETIIEALVNRSLRGQIKEIKNK